MLVTDGADAAKLEDVRSAAEREHVNVELIAPAVGGIEASDGTLVGRRPEDRRRPVGLYDAVVLAVRQHGASALAALPAARDFVADAYAHCKFIGYAGDAGPLFEATGLASLMDDGFISLDEHSAADFITHCADLRFWPRQASIAEKAAPILASRR